MTTPPERQREDILEAYWQDLKHLRELGLIRIVPEGVIITPLGINCFLQDRKSQNGDYNPMEAS